MKTTNRRTASPQWRQTWPLWLAILALPGLAACNLKGDPAGYLRRGQASKEPVGNASSPSPASPIASVATARATSPAASVATSPSASPNARPPVYTPATAAEPRSTATLTPVEPLAPQTKHVVAAAPVPSAAPSAHPVAAPSSSPSLASPIDGKRNVSIGGAAVSGGNISNAARVVARLRAPLRACYSAAITSGQGSLRFTINVGKTGAVTSASAQRSGELSNDLVACATGVVKSAQFDPPEYGMATIQVPATFVVQ